MSAPRFSQQTKKPLLGVLYEKFPSLSKYEDAWRMTEGRQFKKPEDVNNFFESIQHQESKQVWSSCVAAARADYASAKSQVEQCICDVRIRVQRGGANVPFWQHQLQLKTAEYEALDVMVADVGDEEDASLSRSIERVWAAFARAEQISSETELLDIIMEMEQSVQRGGASTEFVEMQLRHKMEELQALQAINTADRERPAPRHPVLRGSDAHARAQQVLAESCLINMIQQLKELGQGNGEMANFVQEQLRLTTTELQELQARKVYAKDVAGHGALGMHGERDRRVEISYVRVQRMVAESLLLRLVLNCEEQGQNGGGTAFFMQRKLWIERLRALQKEGQKELWNEQLQQLMKEAAASENDGEEVWRARVGEWLSQEEHLGLDEGSDAAHARPRGSEKSGKRRRKDRAGEEGERARGAKAPRREGKRG